MEKTYKILKMVLLALVLVAILLGAKRLYDTLSAKVDMNTLATKPTQAVEVTEPPQAATEATQSVQETEAAEDTVPDFTFYDLEGNAHKLSDYRGKPVILNFWASWCGPCKGEMPDFEEKYQEYGEQIHFLLVNLTDGSYETVETASAFLEEQGFTFPAYFDSDSDGAMKYGVNAIPVTYFLDAEGKFVAWQQGMLSAEALQQGIDLLLAE